MSVSKINLSKIGIHEGITCINTIGLGYIYYELNKLGFGVNKRIKTISEILKKLNNNVNVINQHLMKHLYHHKTILDIDNQSISDNMSESQSLLSVNEEMLNKLRELEERILYLESNSNPIFSSKIIEKDFENNVEKQHYSGKDTEPIF